MVNKGEVLRGKLDSIIDDLSACMFNDFVSQKGFVAGIEGKEESDNPFKSKKERKLWVKGWKYATRNF